MAMTDIKGINTQGFDHSVRPQDDLFRHTNGDWLKNEDIPADQAVHGSFYKLRDDSEDAVKAILEEAQANSKPGVSQQIGDMYASFLDEARANELGAAPIAADLARIASTDFAGITHLMGELERGVVSGIFGMYVNNDPGNPERYLVNLYQGGLGLPDESYYHDEKYSEYRDAYVPYIANMLQHAGWSAEDADKDAATIMQFETGISKLHWNVVETRDAEKTYNLITFEHLKSMMPTFDWDAYLAGMQLDSKILFESVVMTPSFFEGLDSVYNEDNIAAVRLWLQWQVINSTAPYLSDEFVNTRFDFYGKTLTGQPEMRARWKRGVQIVEGALGEAVGEIYVAKHFPPQAKERMDVLVHWLIEAYRESITNLTWMTEETKQKALIKLSKFNPKIGYPSKWKDYSALVIDRNDLVGNVNRASAWQLAKEAAKIGAPLDREEWHMTPQTVNAYYNPGFNEIVFPAAILQAPFFSLDADDAVNFGGIGGVIGHEIGHGFDDQGSKYDGDGALISWWTDEDRAAFEDLTKMLIAQYDELTPEGLSEEYKVNGALTIGENIGDLGGITIAYKAYLMSLEGKEPPVIDGLTGAQRFFMSWGLIWRGKSREAIAIQRLATDPHSPSEFRCNQVASNFDSFYEAFDVTENDAMWLEPAKRVSIW
jgi:putative endopeptidase